MILYHETKNAALTTIPNTITTMVTYHANNKLIRLEVVITAKKLNYYKYI